MNTQVQHLTSDEVKSIQASFINKVYMWMCGALLITGFVALRTISSESLMNTLFGGTSMMPFYVLIFAELGLVWWLSASINKMSSGLATALFILYSALNGLTLAVVFLLYTKASIASTFFVTAGTFGVMSAYGYFTKKDLTSWGNLLFMALVGFIIASIVNIFLQSSFFYWLITYAGILIFVGLTAYDTQKIKKMSLGLDANSEEGKKGAIMGALMLYLDFINLFLLLLRVLGNRR
tara:strand:- start:1899 stop:2606 length:708 start_codon:yes stop_codon:yes gene_type:complete